MSSNPAYRTLLCFVRKDFSIDRCSRDSAISALAIATSIGLSSFRLAPEAVAVAATVSGGNSFSWYRYGGAGVSSARALFFNIIIGLLDKFDKRTGTTPEL